MYFRNNLLAYFGHLPINDLYILTLINSKLIREFYKSKYIESSQKAFPQVKISYLRSLPFRRIAFITSKEQREEILEDLKKIYQKSFK